MAKGRRLCPHSLRHPEATLECEWRPTGCVVSGVRAGCSLPPQPVPLFLTCRTAAWWTYLTGDSRQARLTVSIDSYCHCYYMTFLSSPIINTNPSCCEGRHMGERAEWRELRPTGKQSGSPGLGSPFTSGDDHVSLLSGYPPGIQCQHTKALTNIPAMPLWLSHGVMLQG